MGRIHLILKRPHIAESVRFQKTVITKARAWVKSSFGHKKAPFQTGLFLNMGFGCWIRARECAYSCGIYAGQLYCGASILWTPSGQWRALLL